MDKIGEHWLKVIFIVDNPYTHPYKKGEIYWGYFFEPYDCYYLCMTLDGKRITSSGYGKELLIPLSEYRDKRINEILE